MIWFNFIFHAFSSFRDKGWDSYLDLKAFVVLVQTDGRWTVIKWYMLLCLCKIKPTDSAGCVGLLWGFSNISVISRLTSWRYPISEIEVTRPGFEPWIPCSASQELDHSTTAAFKRFRVSENNNYSVYLFLKSLHLVKLPTLPSIHHCVVNNKTLKFAIIK